MKKQSTKITQALNTLMIVAVLVSFLGIPQPAYADRGRHRGSHPRLVEDWRAPRHYSNNYHRPAPYRNHHRDHHHSNYRPAPRPYFDRQYAWEPVYYQPYRGADYDNRYRGYGRHSYRR